MEKVAKVFTRNELVQLQVRMKNAINAWDGVPASDFETYTLGNDAEHRPMK